MNLVDISGGCRVSMSEESSCSEVSCSRLPWYPYTSDVSNMLTPPSNSTSKASLRSVLLNLWPHPRSGSPQLIVPTPIGGKVTGGATELGGRVNDPELALNLVQGALVVGSAAQLRPSMLES
eukprot:CAMPEP_0174705582 /NCGR_PEP_ID=MMETSP1094-20130205/8761_1 /TAXON_ID=156173 /ORGANISM="Chrysochromulina brevifilum, Strain UTEX LB 985" /LENGTH=121 /DNA_ID=CAMNT_0015903775 /DNA_START=1103 /DNA_END=1465 /DNA_ORIENTATION=-